MWDCESIKKKKNKHQTVSSSLALLYFSRFSWGRQGSSPNRGQSPIEWGSSYTIGLCFLLGPLPKKRKGEEERKEENERGEKKGENKKGRKEVNQCLFNGEKKPHCESRQR